MTTSLLTIFRQMANSIPRTIEKTNKPPFAWLAKIELYFAAAAVTLLVLTSLSIILIRSLSHSAWAVSAVDTLSAYPSHLMLVAALLGGSLAISRGESLRMEVLNSFFSQARKRTIEKIVAAFAFVFFSLFLGLAIRYATIDFRWIVVLLYFPLFFLIALKLFISIYFHKAP